MDTQASLKKKTAISWSRMLLDKSEEGTILDLDKYEIMRRLSIHTRDLRVLNPLLSYPFIILGRERASFSIWRSSISISNSKIIRVLLIELATQWVSSPKRTTPSTLLYIPSARLY